MSQPSDTRAIVNSLAAGSASGVMAILAVHPMDTIRTRLQTSSSTQFKGAVDCARQTISKEGVKALYKGMAFPILAQGLYKSIMFGGFEAAQKGLKRFSNNPNKVLSLPELFLCGGFAGAMNSLVVTPVELCRNRLMVQYSNTSSAPKYSGPVDVVRSVVRQNGIKGMWKGQVATLCRDFPGVGAFYVGNTATSRFLKGNFPDMPPIISVLLGGASAGLSFWSVALPVDAIKSIIQTDTTNRPAKELIAERFARDGLKGFYRGWTVAFTRGIPSATIVFLTYSTVLGLVQKL